MWQRYLFEKTLRKHAKNMKLATCGSEKQNNINGQFTVISILSKYNTANLV